MANSGHEIDRLIRDKLLHFEEEPSLSLRRRVFTSIYARRIAFFLLFSLVLIMGVSVWHFSSSSESNELDIQTNDTVVLNNAVLDESMGLEATNENRMLASENESNHADIMVPQKIHPDSFSGSDVFEEMPDTNPAEGKAYKLSFKKTSEAVILNNLPARVIRVADVSSNPASLTSFNSPKVTNTLAIHQLRPSRRYSVSLALGYDVSWKQLIAMEEEDGLADYRLANEDILSNFSYDIRFSYHIKNWQFGVGLEYTSVGEKIHYDFTETVVDPDGGFYTIDTLWANIYTNDQMLTPIIIGYTRVWNNEYKDVQYSINNSNRYTYIEIPIELGYHFRSDDFSVCPTVGISYGFLYAAKGYLPLSTSNSFETLSQQSTYLKKSVFTMSFSVKASYVIAPYTELYLSPFYKHKLSSLYQNYPLQGMYRNVGIKFGVCLYLK